MLYEAAIQAGVLPPLSTVFPSLPRQMLSLPGVKADWQDVVLRVFDPRVCCNTMKAALTASPEAFDSLRKHFPERHEFGFVDIGEMNLSRPDRHILGQLGFPVLGHI